MKKWQILLAGIAVFGLAVMLGCASFMDAVTPCYIPEEIIEFVGVDVPLITWMPFTSLFDARYVKTKMYYQYLLYNNLMTTSIGATEKFQQMLFSPTGPIGLLFPTLFGGTLGAMFVPRLKEKEKIKEAIEKVKNGGQ